MIENDTTELDQKNRSPKQFSMRRLQVLNWGTFSDLHDISIAEKGFLFTGRSGSGKSTLLDAIATILTQPGRVEFNAAAREGERAKKSDRNVLSYIRGAYAEQTETESGEIATQYMRKGTTRSAIALSYCNGFGKWVVLVQVLSIKGASNSPSDVHRLYMIFEREFNLKELSGIDNDTRKIKQHFAGDAHINDEFRPHSERFRRILGIESEMALTLLHKTQSAKNLGELNAFLRSFMLDEPDTFAVADRLVSEFGELDQAHNSVVTARLQIETLKPARDSNTERIYYDCEKSKLKSIRESLDEYTEGLRKELLRNQIADIDLKVAQSIATRNERESQLQTLSNEVDVLEQQHRDLGGDAIDRLERDLKEAEASKTTRLAKLEKVQSNCRTLDWKVPTTAQTFVEMVTKARDLLDDCTLKGEGWREKQFELSGESKELEVALNKCRAELNSLKRQPSNIPHKMLQVRTQIANAIGVHEDSLPFAGELIDVLPEHGEWRGAIERVLHSLALSLLVENKDYSSLTNYVNNNDLGIMLVYHLTSVKDFREPPTPTLISMFSKLKIKRSVHSSWLEIELKRQNYDCVSSAQALRNSERSAITKEGLIKSSKSRHVKDDRHSINNRQAWVLGSENREKLASYQAEESRLAQELEQVNSELLRIINEDKKRSQDVLLWNYLINVDWQDIDVKTIVEKITSIEDQLERISKTSKDLSKIADLLKAARDRKEKTNTSIFRLDSDIDQFNKQRKAFNVTLSEVLANWPDCSLSGDILTVLASKFSQQDQPTLTQLDKISKRVDKVLEEEINEFSDCINGCEQIITGSFNKFINTWQAESADMDPTLKSLDDFLSLLNRLENDNLPKYEERFFELLKNQSNQNLAALNTHINQARKRILEKMDLVNVSLRRAPFGEGTHLQIITTDRNIDEVKVFRQNITSILNHAWSDNAEESERRFAELRTLVKRLTSHDSTDRNWKDLVLDVRKHVEFIGQEIDFDGREIETYRSGAGKSGGQRQKLTSTCLAAALHYQLGRSEDGVPIYAAVVMDEAFDKADHEFTAISMNIFEKFGFQMIIATPIKSVMTLESFIGGACFIDIRDRKNSSHLPIEYDETHKRLKLSENQLSSTEIAVKAN